MNKTLSQKICELVGLQYEIEEPDYRVQDNNGNICEYFVKRLDFENPDNFVKLYELMVDEENNLTGFIIVVLTHLDSLEYFPCNRKSYLKVILAIMQEKSIRQKWKDKIKQSIRDYDGWVWG